MYTTPALPRWHGLSNIRDGCRNCMTEYNEEDKSQKEENSTMQSSQGTKQRRLITFKEFVRGKDFRGPCLTLREAGNQVDATEIEYCVTGLPKNLPQEEKRARLSDLADTITNITNSDVFCFSLWIG
jgi:hypothetical protein